MSTKEFPRVERELFPEFKQRYLTYVLTFLKVLDSKGICIHTHFRPLYLLSVNWEEARVQELCSEAVEIFERNVLGPRKYMKLYDK